MRLFRSIRDRPLRRMRGAAVVRAAGEKLAGLVLRRHRLVELFLVQVMGMRWDEVHDEAEQLEHVVSERLIEQIDDYCAAWSSGNPDRSSSGREPSNSAVIRLIPMTAHCLALMRDESMTEVTL